MLKAFILTCVFLLGGCFGFVHIPGGAVEVFCVAEWAKEGALIKLADGRSVQVMKLLGRSSDCRDPAFPIRAEVALR